MRALAILAAAAILAAGVTLAQGVNTNLTLAWTDPTTNLDGTALTDLAGCKLYQGAASGAYGSVRDVGNVTSAAVTGLAYVADSAAWDAGTPGYTAGASNVTFTSPTVHITNGTRVYFAVTAYNTNGIESPFSAELVWAPGGSGLAVASYVFAWGVSPTVLTNVVNCGTLPMATVARVALPRQRQVWWQWVCNLSDGSTLAGPVRWIVTPAAPRGLMVTP